MCLIFIVVNSFGFYKERKITHTAKSSKHACWSVTSFFRLYGVIMINFCAIPAVG